jgi:predicted TIM-barrel fold metal-dependent hydrolase
MLDSPVIDVHVHTYPSREIGRQAMMGSGRTDYGGTVEELLAVMARTGIRAAVQVNMTPIADMRDAALARLPQDLSPAQRQEADAHIAQELKGRLQRRNRWTCQMARQHPQLVAFIGLDPTVMTPEEMLWELEECLALGARGLKLHPAAQRFYPADQRLFPVYERAQELGLPITFHCGPFALGPDEGGYAHPHHYAPLLRRFPRLRAVLAHAGLGAYRDALALAQEFPQALFDCCGLINGSDPNPLLADDEAAAFLRAIGTQRIMFGSDYPWFDPALDAARIARLPLSPQERRAVLHDNAARLLGR